MRERIEALVYHVLPWLRTARHASSRGVSPKNWEFHVLLYEKVNHNKWRPVQVPLAWSGRFYLDSNTWLFGSHQQSNIR